MADAQELRRVRLRLCADRPQGAGLAVGRRGAVRRILRIPREPRSLALYRRHPRGQTLDRGGARLTAASDRMAAMEPFGQPSHRVVTCRRGLTPSRPTALLPPQSAGQRAERHEIWDLLRAAAATAMGAGRRAETLPERLDAARSGRPAGL